MQPLKRWFRGEHDDPCCKEKNYFKKRTYCKIIGVYSIPNIHKHDFVDPIAGANFSANWEKGQNVPKLRTAMVWGAT